MRGGFVACLAAPGCSPSGLEPAADQLRWHRGEAAEYRHGGLSVICRADDDHGPSVEIRDGTLFLAHGAPPGPFEQLERRDRFVGIESDGRGLRAIRDPMGEVPLFYRHTGDALWLASEIHPLLAVAPADPDLEWLAAFSAMVEYPERTAWSGIRRVLPGEVFEVDADLRTRSRRYFDPRAVDRNGNARSDPAVRLRQLFSNAVEKRSTARSGVLLSGGLDSSAVAVVAAQRTRLTLLTISYPGLPEVDETNYARAAADAAGIPLTVLDVDPRAWDPAEDIETLGMPPLGAPTGMYAEGFRAFVARGCDVVLDGHDGDGTLGNLYAWSGNTLLDLRLDRLARAARAYGPRVIARDVAYDFISPQIRRRLRLRLSQPAGRESFRPYFHGATGARLADDLRWSPPRRGWNHAQFRALLPPTTQHFEETEQVAARCGIDVQHPFADRALIEFLIVLPHAVKVSSTRLKPLLREALGDLLPAAIAERDDKVHFAPVLDARVDFDTCYRWIRDSPHRLPDVDYGRLFRDATRPRNDRMLWIRLANAHAFLAVNRS